MKLLLYSIKDIHTLNPLSNGRVLRHGYCRPVIVQGPLLQIIHDTGIIVVIQNNSRVVFVVGVGQIFRRSRSIQLDLTNMRVASILVHGTDFNLEFSK